MGRSVTSRLILYIGTAINAGLWLFVLFEPFGTFHIIELNQIVSMIINTVLALLGAGTATTALLSRVKESPKLVSHFFETFELSIFAYTLTYWIGKSTLTGLLHMPIAVAWIIRATVIVIMLIFTRKNTAKMRILIALASLIVSLALPTLDLLLFGLVGLLANLCNQKLSFLYKPWLIKIFALVILASFMLAVKNIWQISPIGISNTMQMLILFMCLCIQIHNFYIFALINRFQSSPDNGTKMCFTESRRSL